MCLSTFCGAAVCLAVAAAAAVAILVARAILCTRSKYIGSLYLGYIQSDFRNTLTPIFPINTDHIQSLIFRIIFKHTQGPGFQIPDIFFVLLKKCPAAIQKSLYPEYLIIVNKYKIQKKINLDLVFELSAACFYVLYIIDR